MHEALRESALIDEQDVGRAIALVREFFTADGRVPAADVLLGVRRVAASLGVAAVTTTGFLYANEREPPELQQ